MSDRQITESSTLLTGKMLETGDSVMEDRGFDTEDLLASKGVKFSIPPRLGSRDQLSGKDVEKMRRIAELRIHVEIVIGRTKQYDILNLAFQANMATFSDEIIIVCFLLTNVDKPLVS